MFRVRALKDGKQIQSIEYEDLQDGLSKMAEMYPDCILEQTDMAAEKAARDAQDLIDVANRKPVGA